MFPLYILKNAGAYVHTIALSTTKYGLEKWTEPLILVVVFSGVGNAVASLYTQKFLPVRTNQKSARKKLATAKRHLHVRRGGVQRVRDASAN